MMMKKITLLAASLALAAAAGCNKPPQPKTDASAGPSGASAGPSGAPPSSVSSDKKPVSAERASSSDAALTEKVKSALANDAGLKTLKLDVDANSGVVSLKGRVDSDETKQRIQEITQSVPGVTWVQNQVSVAPNAS